MKEVFLLTLQQFGVLFVFIIIGYLLNRFKIIGDAKPLSSVLMWVFIPAVVFDVFYTSFTLQNIKTALPYFLAGLALLFVTIGVSYPIIMRYKDRITRNTFWYSLVVTNMSYVGFTLVKNVFPELYLFFMIFIIGFQVYIFTVGVLMLGPEGKKFSLKGLISPIMIALVLGMIFGPVCDAAEFKLPEFIEKIISSASACMSPVAMVITGFTLAKLPIKKVFSRWDVYVFTLLRLIVFPAVFGGLAYLCHLWFGLPIGVVKIIIIYSALPMGINTVVFAEANGGDGSVGAQCAFISHLSCLATLPFIFGLVAEL